MTYISLLSLPPRIPPPLSSQDAGASMVQNQAQYLHFIAVKPRRSRVQPGVKCVSTHIILVNDKTLQVFTLFIISVDGRKFIIRNIVIINKAFPRPWGFNT